MSTIRPFSRTCAIVSIPLPQELSLLGLTLAPDFATLANPRRAFYLASVALAAIVFAGLYRLVHSRLGHLCQSLRQNEELASSIGIDVARYRVLAFAFCSGMGGIAGAFFAAFHQNIYPASYTVADSINFMLYCFLGGLDFVLGPVVGAFLLVIAFEVLGALQQYQALLYGVLMIAVMLFLPNGLLSLGRLFAGRSGDGR